MNTHARLSSPVRVCARAYKRIHVVICACMMSSAETVAAERTPPPASPPPQSLSLFLSLTLTLSLTHTHTQGRWGGQDLVSFEAAALGNLQPENAEEVS